MRGGAYWDGGRSSGGWGEAWDNWFRGGMRRVHGKDTYTLCATKPLTVLLMQWPNIIRMLFDAAAKHQSPYELFRILAEK